MKSSLKETTENSEVSPENLPATQTPADVAVPPNDFFKNGEMEGEFDASDIQIPRFNLSHPVGDLSEKFQPGHLIYNREVDLGMGPVEFTLLKLRKFFIESLPFGSEVKPRIFQTQAEVLKAGLFLIHEKQQRGEDAEYAKPALDVTMLVKGRPEDLAFPFEIQGTPYAICTWTLQSIAFSTTGKKLITASQLGLRNGLTAATWLIQPKREKFGPNFVWVPYVSAGKKNTPEFQAEVKELLGSFGG